MMAKVAAAEPEAKKKVVEAEKKKGGVVKGGAGGLGGEGAAGVKAEEKSRLAQVVTHSAATAVAMSLGQGTTPKDPGKERWREHHKLIEENREIQKAIVEATKKMDSTLGALVNGMVFR